MKDFVFLGTKGTVTAINKSDGREVWRSHLKSSGFVTISLDENSLYAHTGGHLYCLRKSDGKILWENGLSGLGYSITTIVHENDNSSVAAMAQELLNQQRSSSQAGAHN